MKLIEPVPIELDKPRTMLLTQGAFMAAERELNRLRALDPQRSIFRMITEEMQGLKNLDIRADMVMVLLWASLLHEDADLTLDQVGSMSVNFQSILPKILQLLAVVFLTDPDAAEVEDTEKKRKGRPIGPNSGVSAESSLDLQIKNSGG